MRFELLDSLSIPGDLAKTNEDSFSHGQSFACVFDGATVLGENLMPGPSDAHWIAQFGARRLRAHSELDAGSPKDMLRSAAEDAEKSFKALRRRAPRENYETPFASLMAMFIRDDALSALWFGDCAALIRPAGGPVSIVGETLRMRARERDRVSQLSEKAGAAGPAVREQFLPALRASRNGVNTKNSAWLFSPDVRCGDHAHERRLTLAADTLILLASDGFLALTSDYGRYNADELFAAAESRGLAALGKELRDIEASDPNGIRYPRFKSSDDATAMLLALRT